MFESALARGGSEGEPPPRALANLAIIMSAQLIGSVSEAKFKAKIEASRPTIALGATPVVPVVCDTLQAERVRSAIRDSEASPQAHSSHECERAISLFRFTTISPTISEHMANLWGTPAPKTQAYAQALLALSNIRDKDQRRAVQRASFVRAAARSRRRSTPSLVNCDVSPSRSARYGRRAGSRLDRVAMLSIGPNIKTPNLGLH